MSDRWQRYGHVRAGQRVLTVWRCSVGARCNRCGVEVEYFTRAGGKGRSLTPVCFACAGADASTLKMRYQSRGIELGRAARPAPTDATTKGEGD